jgi:hypothetical protein
MPARRDKSIDIDAPVKVSITITGAALADVIYGLRDISEYLIAGNTSGEVKPRRDQHDSYEFQVNQL